MSTWLVSLLVLVGIVLIVFYAMKSKSPIADPKSQERICKSCQKTIPKDYTKALCPHCRKFLS